MTREDYMKEFENRAKGAMYGVAVGDALGAPLEFMDALEIQDVHGPVCDMLGGGWLHLPPGMTTDDTDMTLAVAEGMMATPRDGSLAELIDQIGQRFIAWYRSRPKDIGNTCKAVIEEAERRIRTNGHPAEIAWGGASRIYDIYSGHKSAGNGALMRTVPIGIALDPGEAQPTAKAVARMTHWDEKQTELVADYTMTVSMLVRGMNDFREFMWLAEEYPQPKHITPTGYSLDSFNCALWAIRTSDDFEDAIVRAVNLGGDADTIGAITGGLMGAYDGFEAIPERWVNALPAYITARLDAFVCWAVREEEKEWDRKNP